MLVLVLIGLVGWFGYRAKLAGRSVLLGLLLGTLAATLTETSTVLAVRRWGDGLDYTRPWFSALISLMALGVFCILGSEFYKPKDA